jgi:hypothetical protein
MSLQLATARAADSDRPLTNGIATWERDALRAVAKLALLTPNLTKGVS